MKKIQSKYVVIVVAVVLIVATVILALVLNNKDEKMKDPTPPSNNETVKKDDVYLIVSINPKIMLRINNDKIIEVYQLNDDAVIFTNKELQGLGLEEGVKKVIDIATKNDYLKEDTEIRMSVWEYKNKDEEESTKILETVQTNFLENGIHIKPYIIEESETKEILEILDDYVEKTQDIPVATPTPEPTSTPKPTSTPTPKPSKTPTPTNPSTTPKPTPTPTPTVPATPKPTPTNLDISKLYNKSYMATTYEKLNNWPNELGYTTPKSYYEAMINRCNNNTLLEVYPWLENSPYYGSGSSVESACSFVREMNSNVYYDSYYKQSVGFGIGSDGLTIYYGRDFCGGGSTLTIFKDQGGCGDFDIPIEVKITSDTGKYYIEFNYSGKTTCTAGTDLVFTCDKALFTDDYTGKGIYTFRP